MIKSFTKPAGKQPVRRNIDPVALYHVASFNPVLGVYEVILNAEFLETAVQVEHESHCPGTCHHVSHEFLLFKHKEHEAFVVDF